MGTHSMQMTRAMGIRCDLWAEQAVASEQHRDISPTPQGDMATEMICMKRVLIPDDIWFAEGIFRFNRLRRGAGDRRNRRSLRARWEAQSRTYAGAAAVCCGCGDRAGP